MGRARLGVLAPAALSVCMDASVLAVPAAGAIVSTVLKELSKAFMLKKWFHGDLSAKEAEQLMMQRGKNGSFLVRESRGSPGDFVLSVRVRGRVSHVVIRKQHNKYEVGSGEQFDDLAGLIEHFRNYPMVENSGDVLRLLQPLSFTRLRVCDIDARVDHLKNQKENAENEKCRESFQREFESLCEVNNLQHLTTVEGDKPENINKNRYRNVIPYDRTRVVLHSDGSELELGSDYINANFIRVTAGQDSVQSSIESIDGIYLPKSDSKRPPIFVTKSLTDDGLLDLKKSMALEKFHVDNVDGGTVGDKVYIATQGCLPNTENDFWRMIWQEDVRVIAMITKEVEKGKRKCERYWPELNEETTYACHTVRHVSEYHHADYILREFNVRNAHGTTRAVYQYQFTGWPDHGTPADARAVLTFIADINLKLKQIMHSKDNPDNAVLCVHCSAGVGRTGTFIVLDMIIDKIRNKGMHCNIDIHGAVKTVRGQRSGMVQNESQYKFIYLAVQEYVDGGRKPDVEVNSHYRAKLSHCTIGHQN